MDNTIMESIMNPTMALLDSMIEIENFPTVYEEMLALGYKWLKSSMDKNIKECDMYPMGLEYYLLSITDKNERYSSLRDIYDNEVPGAPNGIESIVEQLEDAYVLLS
jgi:hypothetical protein